MISIAITPAAYEAICSTLPQGGGPCSAKAARCLIHVEAAVVDRLRARRAPFLRRYRWAPEERRSRWTVRVRSRAGSPPSLREFPPLFDLRSASGRIMRLTA